MTEWDVYMESICKYTTYSYPYNGSADEVRIYKKGLTPEQVKELY